MTKTHKSPDEETVDKDMQQAKRTPPPTWLFLLSCSTCSFIFSTKMCSLHLHSLKHLDWICSGQQSQFFCSLCEMICHSSRGLLLALDFMVALNATEFCMLFF